MRRQLPYALTLALVAVLFLGAQAPMPSPQLNLSTIPTPVAVANGGTGTGSTLAGIMRGNASAMTAAELTGDCATSGSNVVACSTIGGNAVPQIVAKTSATTQAANINAGTLYAVPGGMGGAYRVSCYVVLTQVATNSSTLPNCVIGFTDSDTSVSLTPWMTGTSTGNTMGTTYAQATLVLSAKASTNIQFSTASYASSGATPMQFAIHVKLEFLGTY